jgi:hypothetical protein
MKLTALVVLAVAACGGSRPVPPSNRGFPPKQVPAPAPAKAVLTFAFVDGSADPQTGTISGLAVDAAKQPMVGATIVAVSQVLQGEQVAVADEAGAFKLERLPPGHYTLVVYYNDAQNAFELDVVATKTSNARVTNWPLHTTPREPVEIRIDE